MRLAVQGLPHHADVMLNLEQWLSASGTML